MTTDPISLARSYNEGADARLMGISQTACFYKHDKNLKIMWHCGWKDVDLFWGVEVRGRWPIKPLPEIPEYGRVKSK